MPGVHGTAPAQGPHAHRMTQGQGPGGRREPLPQALRDPHPIRLQCLCFCTTVPFSVVRRQRPRAPRSPSCLCICCSLAVPALLLQPNSATSRKPSGLLLPPQPFLGASCLHVWLPFPSHVDQAPPRRSPQAWASTGCRDVCGAAWIRSGLERGQHRVRDCGEVLAPAGVLRSSPTLPPTSGGRWAGMGAEGCGGLPGDLLNQHPCRQGRGEGRRRQESAGSVTGRVPPALLGVACWERGHRLSLAR